MEAFVHIDESVVCIAKGCGFGFDRFKASNGQTMLRSVHAA